MLSLSLQYQQSSDMFFTNGVLGYTGQTLPIPNCYGDMRTKLTPAALAPEEGGHSIGRTEAPPGVLLQLFHQPQKGRTASCAVCAEEATPKLRDRK